MLCEQSIEGMRISWGVSAVGENMTQKDEHCPLVLDMVKTGIVRMMIAVEMRFCVGICSRVR